MSLKASQEFVDQILGKDRVLVVSGKADDSAMAFKDDDGNCSIRLPRWARNEFVILHECAHQILYATYTRNLGHGHKFASVFLHLVENVLGDKDFKELESNYRKHGVPYSSLSKWQIRKIKAIAFAN